MPRHKRGTVVRVFTKEEIGEYEWERNSTDEFITPHGYLYIVEKFLHERHVENEHGQEAYLCRSIATGEQVQLFPSEITTRRTARKTNPDQGD